MTATIIARTGTEFTLHLTIPYNRSMLDFEETLQRRLNEVGVLATTAGLQQFDTEGSPITVGSVQRTSKGQVEKDDETPSGVATLARHVYQGRHGGATACPLDRDARIVVSSTPKSAKMVSPKYAEFSPTRVRGGLKENHGREISRCLVHDIADAVAAALEPWSRRRIGATACRSWRRPRPRSRSAGMAPACCCARTAGVRRWSVRSASRITRASGGTRFTRGRRPSPARRPSWTGWRPRWTGSRRRIPRRTPWGLRTGRRGTGGSWSGTPRSR